MNHETGGQPGRLRRAGLRRMSVPTAALAGVALLAAACGGGTARATAQPASHGATNSTDKAQGAAFTRCMRKNGVPNFPDPNGQGKLFNGTYLKQAGVDPDSPRVQAADSACSHLLPAGVTIPAKRPARTCSNGVCRAGQPPAKPKAKN
jgi:hypothetical protein